MHLLVLPWSPSRECCLAHLFFPRVWSPRRCDVPHIHQRGKCGRWYRFDCHDTQLSPLYWKQSARDPRYCMSVSWVQVSCQFPVHIKWGLHVDHQPNTCQDSWCFFSYNKKWLHFLLLRTKYGRLSARELSLAAVKPFTWIRNWLSWQVLLENSSFNFERSSFSIGDLMSLILVKQEHWNWLPRACSTSSVEQAMVRVSSFGGRCRLTQGT